MKKFSLAILVTLLAFSFSSCRKEKDTIANVTVVDADNNPVVGAFVRVFCPDATCADGVLGANTNRTAVTGTNGKVTFNYTDDFQLGQAGFAVLDIVVYNSQAAMDAYTPIETNGVIKIEEEQTNDQTIICQTCI
ncbi:MAG: hypothetical protein ABF242_08365 [Flavobacteriales bacterium]